MHLDTERAVHAERVVHAVASEEAGRRKGGIEEGAGGVALATLILDNFSYPLIEEIASLGK